MGNFSWSRGNFVYTISSFEFSFLIRYFGFVGLERVCFVNCCFILGYSFCSIKFLGFLCNLFNCFA
jgi:glycogen synthase